MAVATLFTVAPMAVLADGLSGGRVLALDLLLRDLVNLRAGAVIRIIAWGMAISPIFFFLLWVFKKPDL
jgi:hypothetical protein